MSRAFAQMPTPCCGTTGGVIRVDPDGEYVCSRCNHGYTTADLLIMTQTPIKPQPASSGVKMVPVTGNTYPVKDELKMLGARWNATTRVWMVPEHRLTQAQTIVMRGPTQSPSGSTFSRSEYETEEEKRFRQYVDTAKRGATKMETRGCWECAGQFTEAQASVQGGEWDEYWCGCADKPRQRQVTADTVSRSS